jgi:hypothetical protein
MKQFIPIFLTIRHSCLFRLPKLLTTRIWVSLWCHLNARAWPVNAQTCQHKNLCHIILSIVRDDGTTSPSQSDYVIGYIYHAMAICMLPCILPLWVCIRTQEDTRQHTEEKKEILGHDLKRLISWNFCILPQYAKMPKVYICTCISPNSLTPLLPLHTFLMDGPIKIYMESKHTRRCQFFSSPSTRLS